MALSKQDQIPTTVPANLPATMQAIVYEDYGDADQLRVKVLDVPTPEKDELLIQVASASVNPIDYRLRSGEMKGLIPGGFPRVPGFDVSGIVAKCPEGSRFQIGDRVMAFLDHTRGGAAAEYATCSVDAAAVIPESMSFDLAAAVPLAGSTALQSLRDHGKATAGQQVLINGASGGVGMFAVQIAKAYGCHVDAVASGANEDFCRSLGADRFLNYETADFTGLAEKWDLIFDAAGKVNYLDVRSVLAEDGRYVTTEPDGKGILMTLLTWPLSKSGKVMLARPNGDDLRELIKFYETGKLSITIDRSFPMLSAAQAHRYLQEDAEHGKVVIQVAEL